MVNLWNVVESIGSDESPVWFSELSGFDNPKYCNREEGFKSESDEMLKGRFANEKSLKKGRERPEKLSKPVRFDKGFDMLKGSKFATAKKLENLKNFGLFFGLSLFFFVFNIHWSCNPLVWFCAPLRAVRII